MITIIALAVQALIFKILPLVASIACVIALLGELGVLKL